MRVYGMIGMWRGIRIPISLKGWEIADDEGTAAPSLQFATGREEVGLPTLGDGGLDMALRQWHKR